MIPSGTMVASRQEWVIPPQRVRFYAHAGYESAAW